MDSCLLKFMYNPPLTILNEYSFTYKINHNYYKRLTIIFQGKKHKKSRLTPQKNKFVDKKRTTYGFEKIVPAYDQVALTTIFSRHEQEEKMHILSSTNLICSLIPFSIDA